MKLNINSKGQIVGGMNRLTHYLGDKQRIWLQSIIYSTEDKRVRDWYLELPLTAEQTNMLYEILLDDYYTDNEKELLNWLREEYIKEFGIGSTSSIIDTISPI